MADSAINWGVGDKKPISPAKTQELPSTTRWPLSALGFVNPTPGGWILLASSIHLIFQHFSTIPKRHLAFAIVYPMYLGLINRLRFQCNRPALSSTDRRVMPNIRLLWREQGPWFGRYLATFGILGMLLPTLFCWVAPRAIAQPAVSHTVLTMAQVLTEELSHGPRMHMLPTLLVPIGFNAYRMGSLFHWVQQSWGLLDQRANVWTGLGFTLGIVNLVLWTYNLFVFLLLRVTPQYWDIATFPMSKVQWKGQLWPQPEVEKRV